MDVFIHYSILTFCVLVDIGIWYDLVWLFSFFFLLDGNGIYVEGMGRIGGMDEDAGDGYCG